MRYTVATRTRAICLSTACALVSSAAQAQVERNTKPFTPYRVNVVNGILNTTMPFDAKFILWGDVPAPTTEVTLDVRRLIVGTNCSAPNATVPKQRSTSLPRKWAADDYTDHGATAPTNLATKTEQQFDVLVDELDPNSMYCFAFELKPGRKMTSAEAATFSNVLYPAYRTFIQNRSASQLAELGRSDVEPLRQELARRLIEASSGRLTPVPNSLLDPNADPATVAQQFVDATAAVFQQQNIVRTRLKSFRDNAEATARLFADWVQIEGFPAAAPALTTDQLDAVSFFRNIPAQRFVNVLLGQSDRSVIEPLTDQWQEDPAFTASDSPIFSADAPCPSTGVLSARCRDLDRSRGRAGLVAAMTAAGSQVRSRSASVLDALNDQKVDLLYAQNAVNRRERLMMIQLQGIQALLPDIFTLLATTNGTAETRKTWYLSMDTGIAVAPTINEVFPYVGTNMYFRPVNTAVPPHSFGTRFSTLFGFAWTANLTKAHERESLYGDNAMLVLGAGLRATEWLRFTAGGLVFKAFDPNSLIDKTHLAITPFFSISADIDLQDTLSHLFGSDKTPPAGRALTPKP